MSREYVPERSSVAALLSGAALDDKRFEVASFSDVRLEHLYFVIRELRRRGDVPTNEDIERIVHALGGDTDGLSAELERLREEGALARAKELEIERLREEAWLARAEEFELERRSSVCVPGAWGSSERCIKHDGLLLGPDGLCYEARATGLMSPPGEA